jgi:hypothetical protein
MGMICHLTISLTVSLLYSDHHKNFAIAASSVGRGDGDGKAL